ncbi:unnamed protein product [Oppiella nova]|uniref:Cytochrome P450 n=1 Tax=Oppiella nova TaxID=334625 RepID=A0A7R9M3X6_9ACAR|nr:unnamed protein product [Oppiella nova]CAG2170307.1 unnamed protein product [Oppiella nova]
MEKAITAPTDGIRRKVSLDKDVSNGVNEVELIQLMGAYTMDVIASCAFATKTNTYADPNNPFTTNAFNINNIPVWKEILIKKRKGNNEKHNDFLQLLMDAERPDGDIREASDANEAHHVNEGKHEMTANAEAFAGVLEKKLTEDEILAQGLLFFRPDSMRRPKRRSMKREKWIAKSYRDYHFCSHYALISETLRHSPQILRLKREAMEVDPELDVWSVYMEDVMLGNTGVMIEKGVIVEIPVYAIHNDPEYYPDPFTFNPDRFMPENRYNIQPYTYLPFGSGRLHCIGMRFALLSAKLALANISQKFRFSRVTDTDVPLVYIQTVRSGQPIVGLDRPEASVTLAFIRPFNSALVWKSTRSCMPSTAVGFWRAVANATRGLLLLVSFPILTPNEGSELNNNSDDLMGNGEIINT